MKRIVYALALLLLGTSSALAGELEECRRLAPKYQAAVEVTLWDGTRVDLLSAGEAIEVDWAPKWAEAIGQSLYYAQLTDKRPAVILLVKDLQAELRHCLRCQVVCARAGIRLYVEPVEVAPAPIPPQVDPLPPPDESAASPTGREPRILWTGEWQARWQTALASEHPWTQWLKFAVANPDSAYFDKELFPTILYQITGEKSHGAQAWNQLSERIARVPSQDVVRANLLKWLVCYEWLYPALSDAEREALSAWLDTVVRSVELTPLADSDRLVTAWFGLRIWAALGSDVAREITAGEHYAAMEARLVEYARLSEGGEWIEGTWYNSGTTTTLLLGLESVRRLGLAVPAELTALPAQLALAERHRWDNTLSQRLTWGAIQVANYPRAGIRRGDLVMDGWAAAGLHDMIAQAQANGGYWVKPHATAFLFYDPFAIGTVRDPIRELLVCKGQQLLYARSSWADPEATLVMFRCGRHNGFAHHPTADGGDFAMLRKGEWVIARPRAYSDSLNVDGSGANNSLLLGNQPINFARREMLGAVETNGCYWMVQSHGGPWQHGNARTAEYVHDFRRWLVWLPGETDVLLVRDVLDISQPPDQTADTKAYNLGKAAERHAEYIASQGTEAPIPLMQWILHAPVKPEVVPGHAALQWTTPGGQQVRLTALVQPTVLHVRLIDEANHYRGVDQKELGWQIRLVPAQVLDEELGKPIELLHAITVSGPGEASRPAVTLLEGGGVRVGDKLVSFQESGVTVE